MTTRQKRIADADSRLDAALDAIIKSAKEARRLRRCVFCGGGTRGRACWAHSDLVEWPDA